MDLLCILWGLQSIVGHSNPLDMGPIQHRTRDFWQGICGVDLQYRFQVSVHFHNMAALLETHIESCAHPWKEIKQTQGAREGGR